MSNFTWIKTKKREELISLAKTIDQLKYADMSLIIEKALEFYLKSFTDVDKRNPLLLDDEFNVSSFLKSIKNDSEMMGIVGDSIVMWLKEHNRISEME